MGVWSHALIPAAEEGEEGERAGRTTAGSDTRPAGYMDASCCVLLSSKSEEGPLEGLVRLRCILEASCMPLERGRAGGCFTGECTARG